MDFDRALIVRKEWLDMIFAGAKPWELRSRHTAARGRIGLIEAGSGHIMGAATLTDSIGPLTIEQWRHNEQKHRVPYRGNEHLAEKWNHAWVLDGVEQFTSPIPYRHPQGAVIWVRL